MIVPLGPNLAVLVIQIELVLCEQPLHYAYDKPVDNLSIGTYK